MTPDSIAQAAAAQMVPASFAEKAMASLLQLHDELCAEKEKRVGLFQKLMEKEQALAELAMYVRVLEERLGPAVPSFAPPSARAPVVAAPTNVAPPPTPPPANVVRPVTPADPAKLQPPQGAKPAPVAQPIVTPPPAAKPASAPKSPVRPSAAGWKSW